jgi:hypothetical protein
MFVSSINGYEFTGSGGGSLSSNVALSNLTASSIFTNFISSRSMFVSSINGYEFTGSGGGSLSSNVALSNLTASTIFTNFISSRAMVVSSINGYEFTGSGSGSVSSNLALSNLITDSLSTGTITGLDGIDLIILGTGNNSIVLESGNETTLTLDDQGTLTLAPKSGVVTAGEGLTIDNEGSVLTFPTNLGTGAGAIINLSSINGIPYIPGGEGSVSSNLALSNLTTSTLFSRYASVTRLFVSSINGYEFTGSGGSLSSNVALSNLTASSIFTNFISSRSMFVSSINGYEFTGSGGGSLSSNVALSNLTTSSLFTRFVSATAMVVSSINGYEFTGSGGGSVSSNLDLSNLTTSSLFTEYVSATTLFVSSINGYEFTGSGGSISSNISLDTLNVNNYINLSNNVTNGLTSLARSTDGSNWANTTGNPFLKGAFGSHYSISRNLWVATGLGNTPSQTLAYSTDANSWSYANSGGFNLPSGEEEPFTYTGTYVTYVSATNLWLAGGSGIGVASIQRSTDGSNWIANASGGCSSIVRSIQYGNGIYVATGNGSNASQTLQYSTDGSNWRSSRTGGFSTLDEYVGTSLTYNGTLGAFFATGQDLVPASTIQKSTDGSNWRGTGANIAVSEQIAWGSTILVATSNDGGYPVVNKTVTSTDGTNWRVAAGATPINGQVTSIMFSSTLNQWNASLGGGEPGNPTLIYSTDGNYWTPSVNSFEGLANNVHYNEVGQFWLASGVGAQPTPIQTLIRASNITTTTITVSSINGYEFPGSGGSVSSNLDLSNLTTSSLFTEYVSATTLIVSSINGYEFTGSSVSSNLALSNLTTSTLFSGYVSATTLIVSSINGYEFTGSGTSVSSNLELSNLTTSTLFSGYVSATTLIVSSINGFQFTGSGTSVGSNLELSNLTTSSLFTEYVSATTLVVSSINGFQFTGSGTSVGSNLELSNLTTSSLFTEYVSATTMIVDNISVGTITVFGPSTLNVQGSANFSKSISLSNYTPGPFGELIIAVGDYSPNNDVQKSIDGINWETVTLPAGSVGANMYPDGIATNGSNWVITIANNLTSSAVVFSTDSVSWVTSQSGIDNTSVSKVAYGNGKWLVGGYDGIQSSTDGRNWITTSAFVGGVANNVAYGNGLWVGVGPDNQSITTIRRSTDTVNWTTSVNGSINMDDIKSIVWNGSYWLIGGYASVASNAIQKSTDTINWTSSIVNTDNGEFISFAWNGLVWIACGGNVIQKSTDGLHWSPVTNQESQSARVTWTGTKFITSGAIIQSSTDGTSWTTTGGFGNQGPFGAQGITTGITIGSAVSSITTITSSNIVINGSSVGVSSNLALSNLTTSTLFTNFISSRSMFVSSINGYEFTGNSVSSNLDLSNLTTSSLFTEYVSATTLVVSSINGFQFTGSGTSVGSNLDLSNLTTSSLFTEYVSATTLVVSSINGYEFTGSTVSSNLALSNLTTSSLFTNFISSRSMVVSSINGFQFTGSGGGSVSSNLALSNLTTSTLFSDYVSLSNFTPGSSTKSYVAGGNNIQTSTDGSNWTTNGFSLAGNVVTSIANNASMWVGTVSAPPAQTPLNTMYYSSDSLNYSLIKSGGFTPDARGVAYSVTTGGWAAVGGSYAGSATLQTSTDGLNWVNIQDGFSISGNAIIGLPANASQNLAFIAVGTDTSAGPTGNIIQTSTDFYNWTKFGAQSLDGDSGNAVAYDHTKTLNFIAIVVGDGFTSVVLQYVGNQLSISAEQSGPVFSLEGLAVAVGSNLVSTLVVAGGRDADPTKVLQISTDGFTWELPVSHQFTTAVRGILNLTPSGFIAVGNGATTVDSIQYSEDGLTWYSADSGGFTGGGYGISAYKPSSVDPDINYIAVGNDNDKTYSVQYSTDGYNWAPGASVTPTPTTLISGVGSYLTNTIITTSIASAGQPPTATNTIIRSTDSQSWSYITSGGFDNGGGYRILWDSNTSRWYATGRNNLSDENLQISTDGLNWSGIPGINPPGVFGDFLSGIGYNGSKWIATGRVYEFAVDTIFSSTDSSNWTVVAASFEYGSNVLWDGTNWWVTGVGVGVGVDGGLVKSVDNGINFTSVGDVTTNKMAQIAYNGSNYLAVGDNAIWRSANGTSWTQSIFTGNYTGVTWAGSFWIVTRSDSASLAGSILRSADGINFTNLASGGLRSAYSISYRNLVISAASTLTTITSSNLIVNNLPATPYAGYGTVTSAGPALITLPYRYPTLPSVVVANYNIGSYSPTLVYLSSITTSNFAVDASVYSGGFWGKNSESVQFTWIVTAVTMN